MHYTIDSLRTIMDSPIPHDKWGIDTERVISILRIIFGAGCSSCMFRRKVSELRRILDKYGDTIDNNEPMIVRRTQEDPRRTERIPCPDCVAKHLSEAYVLQGEFYQGYTEYLELIKTHLNEALSECPKDNKVVLSIINNCLRSVLVDGRPSIPLVLTVSELGLTEVAKNTDDVQCSMYKVTDILKAISPMTDEELIAIKRFVDGIPAYTMTSPLDVKFEWYGRLALIADTISKYSQILCTEIRRRRLKYYNNPIDKEMSIMQCVDISIAVSSEITNRGIDTNEHNATV